MARPEGNQAYPEPRVWSRLAFRIDRPSISSTLKAIVPPPASSTPVKLCALAGMLRQAPPAKTAKTGPGGIQRVAWET
ncbi:hypothetical protein D3C74_463380 [compost metagenome]